MGVLVVPTLLPLRIWGCFQCFFKFCIPLGCGYSVYLPVGGSCRAKGPRVFLHLRGETEALSSMWAGLWGVSHPLLCFLWIFVAVLLLVIPPDFCK